MKLVPRNWNFQITDHRSQITSCHFCLNGHQFVINRVQAFRKDPCSGDDRHEIRITGPARHDMNMQMNEKACPRAFTKIQTNDEALISCDSAHDGLRMHDHTPENDGL